MISQEEDVEAHALRRQGWTVSAIARHLGRDRKAIRAHLNGDREPGVRRRPAAVDPFDAFEGYVRQRFVDDPHVWSVTLFDEVTAAGYAGAYATFSRNLRERRLRPPCEKCAPATGRAAAVIAHPPGVETQWDWVEFPDPPAHWGWGKTAYGLLGTLARSGRWRGYLSSSMDQAHLIEGLDQVSRKLDGLTQRWRFDRMATVAQPGTGAVTKSFAHVAKHYGVGVEICPPRRGNRKGVVEKAIHGAAQRWWRTLPEDLTPQQAQVSWDAFCVRVIDPRRRVIDQVRATIAEHAAAEPLQGLPQVPYPATITETRVVSAQALVAWEPLLGDSAAGALERDGVPAFR